MKKVLTLLIIILPVLLLGGCSFGKYDGMTAEEWADEHNAMEEKYEKFRSCVEDYDSLNFEEKEQYGGVFYYCE